MRAGKLEMLTILIKGLFPTTALNITVSLPMVDVSPQGTPRGKWQTMKRKIH